MDGREEAFFRNLTGVAGEKRKGVLGNVMLVLDVLL
jgi:hypothetical protein